ncbi:MAG: hypothetical protein QOH95_2626 [Gaiellaceae bacterium]|jgi:hypothetical protein|nr:hypothetical protein [Gaiellaceae bacterium]
MAADHAATAPETPGVAATRSDSVHERAKSGSLVVAILTILVGADPIDIRHSSHVFRVFDYAAIGFWIAAVLLFLGAQAFREGKDRRGRDYGKTSLVAAMCVAVIAGALTITAIGAKALGKAEDHDTVLLGVTPTELAAFRSFCGPNADLYGSIRTADLADEFVVLTLDEKPPRSRCDQIRVPRAAIVALVEHPCRKPPVAAALCGKKPS